ncbi:hypothetical protein N9B82_06045 [Saprospiraceae bacterium]|nr:hypothetical protein [Saprospiraceae bacterium]
MKFYFILSLLLIYTGITIAQDAPVRQNEIGLSVGYNSGYFKDLNFSVLNYKDRGLYTKFHYHHRFSKTTLKTSLEINYDNIHSDVAPFFSTLFPRAGLKAEYLFDISQNDKWHITAGPMLSSDNQMLLFNGFLSFSFLFVHSAGISSDIYYQLDDKNLFRFSMQLPLVHLLVRPPYSGFDKGTEANQDKPLRLITNGKLATVNEYLAANTVITYKRVLNSRFDLDASYGLHFQRTYQEHYLIHLQNRYKLSLNYKF